jgi:uncharacterized protein
MSQSENPNRVPRNPPLIRDIKLITRYSRANFNEDLRFREHIISRLNLPAATVDSTVHKTTEAVWEQIDCVACANCCKTLAIVVDSQDIQRISARLRINPNEFKKRYCEVHADKTVTFKSSPCTFLAQDGRCTIYEDRPKACQDYPYLRDRGFAKRTITMVENCSCCPIVFNVWQLLKVSLGFKKPPK